MNEHAALITASKINAGLLADAKRDAANAAQAATRAIDQAQTVIGAFHAGGKTLFEPPSLDGSKVGANGALPEGRQTVTPNGGRSSKGSK